MTGLTKQDIEAVIANIEYLKVGKKTTLCLLTLESGFEVVATASCVNPEDYNEVIGNQIAYQRALDKVWELQGYVAQWRRWTTTEPVTEEAQPAAA